MINRRPWLGKFYPLRCHFVALRSAGFIKLENDPIRANRTYIDIEGYTRAGYAR
jgi:hypothetical protein